MVLWTTKQIYITEKWFYLKKIIQGMLNIFYIVSEKLCQFFFLAGRGRPPPLIADMSAKK